MNIAAMRVRITIQKNEPVVDEFANHTSAWTDYFSCWATASANGRISEEREKAASTHESSLMDFTVRWCSETGAVNSKQYRVLLNGRIYNADPTIPDSPEEWLERFNVFSIYQVLPEIITLWGLNMRTESDAKKNFAPPSVR